MAHRGPSTFKKRQKEMARLEKQREKFAKRMQRKAEKRLLNADPAIGPEAATELAPPADDAT